MYSNIIFLLLATVCATVSASGYSCTKGNVINRPVNNQSFYFPTGWNETQSAPKIAKDQSCYWLINIPTGYYAKLSIMGKMEDQNSHIQTVDTSGNMFRSAKENMVPYYFPFSRANLFVNTETAATFGFKVEWAPIPSASIISGIGEVPHVVNITKDVFGSLFGSSGGISLLSYPADRHNYTSLRSVMVFNGNDANAQYVDNLYSLYENHNQYITPNTGCFVVNVEARNTLDQLLVQNAAATKNLQPYKELHCGAGGTCTKSLVPTGNSPSGLVYLGNSNQTLVTIDMDPSANLTVYYACKTGNIINRNALPYYFPSSWNETQTAPDLAADQSCSWTVTIPKGYYAKLIISGKRGDNISHFQTVDTNGNILQTMHERMEPYYFPSPKFTLIVNNEAAATFGFKIVWAQFPQGVQYTAGIGGVPHAINITQDVFTAEFKAVPGVSLLAFPADRHDYSTLRSVMIFEGKDYFNGLYVNTLYNLYKTGKQYITMGQGTYIVNVEARNVMDQLLVQESGYTRNIHPYHELDCGAGKTCTKSLKGMTNQMSGLVYLGNSNQTLVTIQMDPTATLSVYNGGVTVFGLLASYSGSSIQSELPLTFVGGGVIQYVISCGKSDMTFHLSN